MKLVVLAHTPPPHHGQSFMVAQLLEALRADARFTVYHINARYSVDTEDIGRARLGKVWLAFKYAAQALWHRFRHGAAHLYYVPAFPQRAPIYRDWIVLGLCRPFFRRTIFHWHAIGLDEWLQTQGRPWERWISRRIYARPDLSVIVRPFNRADPEAVRSKAVAVVLNGVPDPCADFDSAVLPQRRARLAARRKLLAGESLTEAERAAAGGNSEEIHALFLSLCYSGKGLFDTVEAVALAQARLKGTPLRFRLTVAGNFWNADERAEFERRITQPDLQLDGPLVAYRGYVAGADKHRLLMEADCFCFPTRMPESFGLVLVEAMAYGLPLITTDWLGLPELLPAGWPGVVPPGAPADLADKLVASLTTDPFVGLREHFLQSYTLEKFAASARAALLRCDTAPTRG